MKFTAILSLSKDEQLRSTTFFDKLRMVVHALDKRLFD
jgi:hypothetical protein